jgi:UDP-N-acetylmuramate dehydrogenase
MNRPFPDELLQLPHRHDVPFARLTTLGLGGLCHWLFEPTTEDEAQTFVRVCHREGLPYRVLGGGSNLLVLGDIQEPVLRLHFPAYAHRQGVEITAPASHGHIALTEAAARAGLSGLEWAGGIPGSLGGAIRMNAGALGGEWAHVLARYRFLTPEGERVEKAPEPGEFGYRWSWLRAGQIVLSATARLAEGDPSRIRKLMEAHQEKRRATQPQGVRSAGCIFKNPPGLSAGQLIEQAGLKNFCVGDAMVSPVHANFLVNQGQATAKDFHQLIEEIHNKVKDFHGLNLETEVEIWR